jgi:hypothetical protein
MRVRCVVACHDCDGPNLYFVYVNCTKQQYQEGLHYEAAKQFIEDNYSVGGPFWMCDENDACGVGLVQQFEWMNADEVTAQGEEEPSAEDSNT